MKKCVICGSEFEHPLPQTKRCSSCRGQLTEQQKLNSKKHRSNYEFKLRNYGISLDTYTEMYVKQKGMCKLCDNFFPELKINRNYINGKIIYLFCQQCLELTNMIDKRTNAAIKYLEHKDLVIHKTKLQ